jgi:GH43 family beta-xylosidase
MEKLDLRKPWIMQRADPYVYLHTDGYYYFTASLPDYNGIALRKSKDLVALAEAEEVMIWHKHESGPMSFHIWAPELHYIGGAWYIYFAAGEKEDIWNIRPYVLECRDEDPMNGTWVEKGMLQCADEDEFSFRAFSLDTTIFESKGVYIVFGLRKSVLGSKSPIFI